PKNRRGGGNFKRLNIEPSTAKLDNNILCGLVNWWAMIADGTLGGAATDVVLDEH
ncbi:hypothetical protein PanWU01x14_303220, partial [Parasponia andersonii]